MKILEPQHIIGLMESRIFATANELGIPKNIARAILIKNVWNKKLSIEAF